MIDLTTITHPSEIDLDKLPWMPLEVVDCLPSRPGIYFAIDRDGAVRHIGQSIEVKGRWTGHHRYEELKAIGGIKIAYLFVESVEFLNQVEKACILWHKPPLNFTFNLSSLASKALVEKEFFTRDSLARSLGISSASVGRYMRLAREQAGSDSPNPGRSDRISPELVQIIKNIVSWRSHRFSMKQIEMFVAKGVEVEDTSTR